MVKQWEERNQPHLRSLVTLLKQIVDLVKGIDGNAVIKYDIGIKKLVVSKTDRKKMLPEDLYSMWTDKDDFEPKPSAESHGGAKNVVENRDKKTGAEEESLVSVSGDTRDKEPKEKGKNEDGDDLKT